MASFAVGCKKTSPSHNNNDAAVQVPDGTVTDGTVTDGTVTDGTVTDGTIPDPCEGHCGNGVMDCGEAYIDCGGACPPCTPVELAPRTNMAVYARVAVGHDGRVMVVWIQPQGGQPDSLPWTCFDGLGWTEPARIAANDPADMSLSPPSIVTDVQGRFHLVHDRGGGDGRRIHYNRWDHVDCTGGWMTTAEVIPKALGLSFNVGYPSVGTDEHGHALVTFSQALAGQSPDFLRECGGTHPPCPTGYHCYQSDPPRCVMDFEQHFTRRTGGAFGSGQWTTPAAIGSNLGPMAHHGAVFVSSSTMAHAVWLQDPTPANHRIYYSQWNGSSWSTPGDVGIGAHVAEVQAYGSKVFVLSNSIFFTSRDISGGAWSTPVDISGGAHGALAFLGLRVGPDGRLHAVWNSNNRIRYAVTDGSGNWLSPKAVSPPVIEDQLYAHEPSLAVDSNGVAHIVWTEAECKDFNVQCAFGSVKYLATRYDDSVPAGSCEGRSAGYVCRASAGLCDVPEVCDGVSHQCPVDSFTQAGTMCRASTEACDPAEVCDGNSPHCPSDTNNCYQCELGACASTNGLLHADACMVLDANCASVFPGVGQYCGAEANPNPVNECECWVYFRGCDGQGACRTDNTCATLHVSTAPSGMKFVAGCQVEAGSCP